MAFVPGNKFGDLIDVGTLLGSETPLISRGNQLYTTTEAAIAAFLASKITIASSNIVYRTANNLAMTSPTYITSGQLFGSGALNGGYGRCPTGMLTGLPFAVSVRFYLTNIPNAIQVMVGQNSCFWLGFLSNGLLHTEFGGAVNTTPASINTSTTPSLNTWHVATMSVSSSTLTLRLDGTVIGTASISGTTGDFTGPSGSTIGSNSGGITAIRSHGGFETQFPFSGILDEVAIFNSDKFPSGSSDSSTALLGNETNLIALYHFDGNGNDTVST